MHLHHKRFSIDLTTLGACALATSSRGKGLPRAARKQNVKII